MQREKQARTHPKAYLIAGIIAAAALILFGLLSSGAIGIILQSKHI